MMTNVNDDVTLKKVLNDVLNVKTVENFTDAGEVRLKLKPEELGIKTLENESNELETKIENLGLRQQIQKTFRFKENIY